MSASQWLATIMPMNLDYVSFFIEFFYFDPKFEYLFNMWYNYIK